ncbi:hypothetical protein C8Q80DRAFT_1210103 [Daedaleopsis nitida]|nr:hypothetical protein C8Q80DRAFT_1210103 [Daedaleopsis nitida]
MSRRQSRISIDARQNDTLLEFENFKKKFLLANKHITKLNSTLSARIEELNAQISTLYVENLRLRASEIALTSQLKKEREKSRKILADTESATHTLMKQLGFIRKSFSVPHGRSTTPECNPQPPRAKRPIPDPNVSPPPNRIARPPTVPVLIEDDEPNMSSPEDPDDQEVELSPIPRKRKTKARTSSSSRLPVPLSKSPPPSVDVVQFEFDDQLGKTGKRRPTRRQSGLLTSVSITTVTTDGLNHPLSPVPTSPVRDMLDDEEVAVVEPDEDEVEAILQSVTKRERMTKKDRIDERLQDPEADAPFEAPRPRERKRHRVTEEPEDILPGGKSKFKDVTNSQAGRSALTPLDTRAVPSRERQMASDGDVPSSATSLASTSTRNFLSTPATTPALSKPSSHLPTARPSSPTEPPPPADSEGAAGGRERRVRKSVNYAEPKLNTKMRKPDPPTGTSSKRASSLSAPQDDPLPISSRSSSSNTTTNTADADTDPVSTGSMKRKKSRAYVPPDDEDESEGTQADAEFGGLRTGTWANVESRRRSVHVSSTRRIEGDDLRRHSMAV